MLGAYRSAKSYSFTLHCDESKAQAWRRTAEWDEYVTGEMEIIDPLTPKATRRRIGFDALPLVDYVSP